MTIKIDFKPSDAAELVECLKDPMWRVCSGELYKIMVKSDDGDGSVVPFKPNRSQRRFISRLWHRNIILKARQLGFTTLVAIIWLDHALFNADQRCGIIAQDRESAENIFRDKVKLAYTNLPESLRAGMPLARDSASELLFAHNNSSVRVATSMRSGTIHRLHISEFGKICANFRDKAKEIITGSLPAVPLDGIAIIESTAEGQDGDFYKMTMRAIAKHEAGTELTERDYRFHFFAWWQEPTYRIKSTSVSITDKDNEYFAEIEAEMKTTLDLEQRNFYVATRDADFSGDHEKMWQEYPSTPGEAFKVSTEGTYYAVQLAAARKSGRISLVPFVEGEPVNTFWDIGNSDGTAIWFHQKIGMQHRFFKFYENWGEPYSFYIKEMQSMGCIWGTHYLPHDADHKRQQGDNLDSALETLQKFKMGGDWEIVPRVSDIVHGIQLTRQVFSQVYIDEVGCKEGIEHLAGYKKTWNDKAGRWSNKPDHNIHSEGADSFRQFAQMIDGLKVEREKYKRKERNWRTA